MSKLKATEPNGQPAAKTAENKTPENTPLGIHDHTPPAQQPAAPPAQQSEAADRRPNNRAIVTCPFCSTAAQPVICEANRTEALFTRYYCPNRGTGCNFSTKIARPDIRRQAQRLRAAEEDFSARE